MRVNKAIIKRFFVYFAGKGSVSFVTFLSFPLIIRSLDKEQYGIYELSQTLVAILNILIPLGILQVLGAEIARGGMQVKETTISYFSTQYYIYASIIIPLLLTLYYFFFTDDFSLELFLLILFISFCSFFRATYMIVLQFSNRPYTHNFLEFLYAASLLSMFLLIISIDSDLTAMSFLCAQILSIVVIIGAYHFLENRNLFIITKISLTQMKKDLRYTTPLMVAALTSWVITSIDRWMLASLTTIEVVAEYSSAYKFSSIYHLLLTMVVSAVVAPKIYSSLTNDGIMRGYAHVVSLRKYLILMGVFFGCIELVVGKQVFVFIVGELYEDAYVSVKPLLYSFIVLSIIYTYNYVLVVRKRTKDTMYAYLIGAVVNVVLNFQIIPLYGAIGAAYSTLITYIIMLFLIKILSKKVRNEINES